MIVAIISSYELSLDCAAARLVLDCAGQVLEHAILSRRILFHASIFARVYFGSRCECGTF
jgi:hypothetical protein